MRGVRSGVARAGAREWRIVFAASFGMLFSYGPIVTFTFGIFVSPLTREFGWTRSELALGLSLANVCFAFTQPLFGALLDRFGARRVIVPSVLVFGMSLLSFCFLTGGIWQFYLAYFVMGACAGGSGSISYYHVVSRLFDRERGLALGLATAGAGVGGMIMPPAVQWIETEFGWRAAYAVVGIAPIAIVIPLVLSFIRDRSELARRRNGAAHHADAAAPTDMRVGQALTSARFWLIALAVFCASTSVMGILAHLVPLLMGRGIAASVAASAVSMLGAASLLSRVVTGYLVDRVPPAVIGVGLAAAGAVGVAALTADGGGRYFFIAAILIGCALSIDGLVPHLVIRHFGLKEFGAIYGLCVGVNVFGWVVGPLAAARSFDATRSYDGILLVLTGALAFGSLLMLVLAVQRPAGAITEADARK